MPRRFWRRDILMNLTRLKSAVMMQIDAVHLRVICAIPFSNSPQSKTSIVGEGCKPLISGL